MPPRAPGQTAAHRPNLARRAAGVLANCAIRVAQSIERLLSRGVMPRLVPKPDVAREVERARKAALKTIQAREKAELSDASKATAKERLAYLSDNFFATNPYSSGLLLCVITLALVVCGDRP